MKVFSVLLVICLIAYTFVNVNASANTTAANTSEPDSTTPDVDTTVTTTMPPTTTNTGYVMAASVSVSLAVLLASQILS